MHSSTCEMNIIADSWDHFEWKLCKIKSTILEILAMIMKLWFWFCPNLQVNENRKKNHMFPTVSGAAMALTKRSRRDTSRTVEDSIWALFNFFFFVQILFQSDRSWYFWMCSLDSVPIQFRMVVAVRNVPSQRARATKKRAGENYC